MDEKHILLVEDDIGLAKLTTVLLESRHYKVDMAHTAAEAFEKSKHNPDLILLDRRLPKMEGLYVGADDYITKPYDGEELFARIEAVLRRSHFSEQAQEEKRLLMGE